MIPSPHTLAFPHTCKIAKCLSLASTFGQIKTHAVCSATIFARASSASWLSLAGTSAKAFFPIGDVERGGGGGCSSFWCTFETIQVCEVDTGFAVWINHTVTHRSSSLQQVAKPCASMPHFSRMLCETQILRSAQHVRYAHNCTATCYTARDAAYALQHQAPMVLTCRVQP